MTRQTLPRPPVQGQSHQRRQFDDLEIVSGSQVLPIAPRFPTRFPARSQGRPVYESIGALAVSAVLTASLTVIGLTLLAPRIWQPAPPPISISHAMMPAIPANPGRLYTVQVGDSLSRIAHRELGDVDKWRLIFEANRDLLRSPSDLEVGVALTLPQPGWQP